MEINKKIATNQSILVWTVLFLVLIVSFIFNWRVEVIALSAIAGAIIILIVNLINDFNYMSDIQDKINPSDSGAESVIVQGKAFRKTGKEKVEGVLYLTNFNLLFEATGKECLKLDLKDISNVQLFTSFRIFKRGIIINQDASSEEQFLLKYPDDWKQLISFYLEAN